MEIEKQLMSHREMSERARDRVVKANKKTRQPNFISAG
jgi:hypothetical protein